MRGEGTLCCHCTSRGIGGASKSHEEGISLGVHDVPVPPLECCAEELAVLLQQVGVALTQLLKQTSGPLHVGEEQRDGSPREVMHTEPPCLALSCCSRSSVTLLLLISRSAFSSFSLQHFRVSRSIPQGELLLMRTYEQCILFRSIHFMHSLPR